MKQRILIVIAFVLCLAPRVILTAINKTANDDHIKPILLWNANGAFPDTNDCWECFQPPFYYGIVKHAAQITGATTEDELRILFQWLNFIFGFGCLFLIFFFQFQSSLPFKWNVSLALFWGLNPKLIAISIQATNDIPVIFIGMLFTLFLLKWIKSTTYFNFTLVLLTVFLAGIVKGNGLVLVFILLIVLFFLFISKQISSSTLTLKTILLLIVIPAVAYFGGYYSKYKKHGNPFLTNLQVATAPNFFTPDSVQGFRKGVTTVWDSFFSFKIKSLIEQPWNTNDFNDDYPAHRTSFFAQLYGQFSNAFFERSPPSWTVENKIAINITRANYCIQLFLLVLFLLGIFSALKQSIKNSTPIDFIHLTLILVYLLFVIRYAYNIRDFANMKLIFLFPALLSMVYFLEKSVTIIKSEILNNSALIILNISTLLYAINLAYFQAQLFANV